MLSPSQAQFLASIMTSDEQQQPPAYDGQLNTSVRGTMAVALTEITLSFENAIS